MGGGLPQVGQRQHEEDWGCLRGPEGEGRRERAEVPQLWVVKVERDRQFIANNFESDGTGTNNKVPKMNGTKVKFSISLSPETTIVSLKVEDSTWYLMTCISSGTGGYHR